MFQCTLLNMRQNQNAVFSTNEAAVLVAPALTEERFNRERSWGKYFWQKKGRYDFVSIHWANNWQDYEQFVVLPTLLYLSDIEKYSSTRVIPDITFTEFCEICMSGRYKAIFLIAHHAIRTEIDGIEFSDGIIPLTELNSFLLSEPTKMQKVSLLFFVCESAPIKEEIYSKSALVQSIASATWSIPLHAGARFICLWCLGLDGYHSMLDAYHLAIDKFIKT